jgi:hypothetical protein
MKTKQCGMATQSQRLRKRGWTLAEIGDSFGVSRQRICQLVPRVDGRNRKSLEMVEQTTQRRIGVVAGRINANVLRYLKLGKQIQADRKELAALEQSITEARQTRKVNP